MNVLSPTTCLNSGFAAMLLFMAAIDAGGGGSAPIPLQSLTARANAIIVAEIVSASSLTDRVAATVTVIRVLKGPLTAGDTVSVEASRQSGEQGPGSVDREVGLFFLQSSAGGGWTVLSPVSGYVMGFRSKFIVIPRNAPSNELSATVKTSILDNVIAEASKSLQNPPSPTLATIDFAGEYRKNQSPAMRELFSQFRSSPNSRLRIAGLRAEIVDGGLRALDTIERELSTFAAGHAGAVTEDLKYYFWNSSPEAVARLGQMSGPGNKLRALRAAAAAALTRIHTRESVPYLAALLNDPDSEFQALGVGGIARFANNVPIGEHHPAPGDWKYRTDETLRYSVLDARIIQSRPEILAFWKLWWMQYRAELN